MSHKEDFSIEWDLHELGDKEKPPVVVSPDLVRLTPREFGRAIEMGTLPANAPDLTKDQAA